MFLKVLHLEGPFDIAQSLTYLKEEPSSRPIPADQKAGNPAIQYPPDEEDIRKGICQIIQAGHGGHEPQESREDKQNHISAQNKPGSLCPRMGEA